jgi:DNA (cytosine-5)-methyltransferase 1
MDEGFRQAGFTTRLAYDIKEHCVNTLSHNHPHAEAKSADLSGDEMTATRVIQDWKEVAELPPVGVVGGPPCQSFSRSNVHKTEDDHRDSLPGHYARLLKGLNEAFDLEFFVFENVPGLLDERHIDLYESFKDDAREAGFIVSEQELDAKNFGVPQQRNRIFVVGLNGNRYGKKFSFPQPPGIATPTVKDAIGELDEPVHYSRSLTPEDIEEKTGHPNHWCMRPKSEKFDPDNDFLEPGVIKGRSFRTLAWDEPSLTVAYGHREVHVHPSTNRRLSILEAMRLQSFPDHYELVGNMSQQIDMVSDAVAPPVAKALAEAIREQANLEVEPRLYLTAAQ